MKHYLVNGEVWGIADGFPVPDGAVIMSDDDVDKIYNPEKYWTPEQFAEHNRTQFPTLSPIEFDIKLNKNGLYDAVQELIKDNFELRIAYTRATFFRRTDPFIETARIELGLSEDQVDQIWTG